MKQRDMSDETRITYLRSDITVPTEIYTAATEIFAGFVSSKQVDDENKIEMMQKAVNYAIDLALVTEKVINSTGSVESGV